VPRIIIIFLMSISSTLAFAGAEYSDDHLSKSMQLEMMEDAFDEGTSNGFKSGKKLTVDQVTDLNRNVKSVNGSINTLNKRVEELQAVELDTIRTSTAAIELVSEAEQLRKDSAELRKKSDSYRADARQTNNKLLAYDKSLNKATEESAAIRQQMDAVLASADEIHNLKLQNANKKAQEILRDANEAALDRFTDYRSVMNSNISCNLKNQRLIDILYCLTPQGWTIDPRLEDENILKARTTFTSTKPRREAFLDLFNSIKKQTDNKIVLKVNFYPNLHDDEGEMTPTVIVSEVR